MTASLEARPLYLPEPTDHQYRVLNDRRRFKLWRAGRRTGKSRGCLFSAVMGHGARDQDGLPEFPGLLHKRDVIWLAPDYGQAGIIWNEDVEPRFKGVDRCEVRAADYEVHIEGGGVLYVRSAHDKNAIDRLRGYGHRLGGVIFDECGHFDLEYAWKSVCLPMLMDNEGWAIFPSTTNRGVDGNPERRIPSYFNLLCWEEQRGERGPDWAQFHGTARDNPRITAKALQSLIDEYEEGDPKLAEEVEAKLLDAEGVYLAFPEWQEGLHVRPVAPEGMPRWHWEAGLDWGYRNPAVLTLIAYGPDEQKVVRWDMRWTQTTAYQAGKEAGEALRAHRFPIPEVVHFDEAMNANTGANRGGKTIAEEFQRGMQDSLGKLCPPLVAAPKFAGSRMVRKQLLHEALRCPKVEGRKREPWEEPKMVFHPDAKECVRTIPKLLIDEKKTEDVDEHGDDHAYESLTSALIARTPEVEREERPPEFDHHQGVTRSGKAINPWKGLSESGRSGFQVQVGWSNRDDPDQMIEE
jgi:hypothetical protein